MKQRESLTQQEFIKQQKQRRTLVTVSRILLLFLFLALWEISAGTGLIDDFIFSSPSRMTRCFLRMVKDRSIFLHMGVTLSETLISFFLVTLIGILGAMLLWSSRTLSEILEPYLVLSLIHI